MQTTCTMKRRGVLLGLLNFILLMNLNCEAKSVLGDVFKQTVGEIAEEVIQNDKAIHRLTQTVNEIKDTHAHQDKQLNESMLEAFLDLKSIIQVDECASNPCVHGLCRDFYNGFSCHCSAGYTGITCGSVDDCPMNACGGNGRCIDLEDDYKCKCWNRKWGKDCQLNVPRDCYEIKEQDTSSSSGVYNIAVNLTGTDVDLEVYCDMETDNGGWTVFQRRLDGSQDFALGSDEYEIGFGRKEGEFWLGLKWLHAMTSNKNYTLRVDMSAADDSTAYQTYKVFRIGDGPGYVLSLTGTSSGTAGDGLSYHNGYPFVTKDNSTHSCLSSYNYYGGWWYNQCAFVTPNGAYITPGQSARPRSEGIGIYWKNWLKHEAIKTTNMKIRPLL